LNWLRIPTRNYGWFGYIWLGKATFLGSGVISMVLARVFHLFRRKEVFIRVDNEFREEDLEIQIPLGERLLHVLLRIVGLLLLAQSTSNKELSLLLFFLGLNKDSIAHFLSVANMKANATRPQDLVSIHAVTAVPFGVF
jgi:hypothetical protein